MLGFTCFCVTFASSVFSPGTQASAQEFNVSPEVMVLGTSLIVLGMAFGPVIFGPLSELYGRKRPLFVGFGIFTICQIPVAVAPNVATILIFRFLQGVFGAAPLTIVGGALVDFWAPVDRGVAVSVFSCFSFAGPTFGPLLGGFVSENATFGWRWTAWITLIMSLLFGVIAWLAYPESFGPVLLQAKAKKLRFATKDWAIHAPADEVEIDMAVILKKYLAKPFAMLALEPILLLITIYISFIYDLFFETYPISFYGERGWSLGKSGLPFIAIIFGVILGGVVNVGFIKTRYTRILRDKGRVPPEERLVPMMVGAVALPIGLFLFAWTSDPSFNPTLQILAGVPAGMGIVLIFLQGFNYIIDVYMMYANSAIAGNTFVRSAVGAAFPMIAVYMYPDMGVKWATTLLGFIAVALIPVPILFFIYGPRIRKMSRFAPQMPPG
nr:putative transporter c36.02c [Quercus suber]